MTPASAEVLRCEEEARILVVDDEPEVVTLLADSLQEADPSWRVETETDPQRALERLAEEDFDCLITDLVMPAVGGLRLASKARSLDQNLALIAITGCGTLERSIEAMRLGFSDFLEKPFDLQEVRHAVSRSLRQRRQKEARDSRFAELAQAKTLLETEQAQLAQKLEVASHDLVLSNKRMARRMDGVAVAADVARTLMGVIELEDLLGLSAEIIGDRIACQTSTLALYETRENAVGLMVRANPETDDPPALSWLRTPIETGVMCRAAQTEKSIHVEDIATSALLDSQETELWPEGRLLVVPVARQGLTVGLAVLHRLSHEPDFAADDVKHLTELAAVMAPAIQTAKLHHRQRCRIYASLERISDAVESRDGYLKGHSVRVQAYAMPIATSLELHQSQIGAVQIAARLHDIGRITFPESAVNHPGPLTDEQWAIVRKHPDAGAEFLSPLEFLGEVGDIIRSHHESYDGTGYPNRKAGEEIPVVSRVIALADAFDAMTSPRPHRGALTIDEARKQIRQLAGQQFDPQAAQAFLAIPVDALAQVQADSR
jgi:putative nucleotidyltransferase with HDIG domain